MGNLDSAVQHLLTAKRISGTRASFAKDNPIEWRAVEEYLTGGARPIGIITEMGLGLLEVEDARRAANPPPPPPPTGKPLTGSITSGGTYTGSYNGVVAISTTQPVVVDGATGNLQFRDSVGGYDLEIRRCRPKGAGNFNDPRWVEFDQGWKRLVIQNNSIENTRGIYLGPNHYSATAPITVITRNEHLNIMGTTEGNSLNDVGNFIQTAVVWGGPEDGGKNPNPGIIEVSWNAIKNVHNRSNPEDVFSIYKTSRMRIHHNLVDGQTKPDSMAGSSQNTITIDGHNDMSLCFDVLAEDNVLVDAYSAYIDGGVDCQLNRNIVVSDGKYADTGKAMRYGYSGLAINRRAIRCSADRNKSGYIGSQGRVDFQPDGGVWTNNVPWPTTPTRQDELEQVAAWRQRAAAAGVVIGA